ncbi:MAG: hypothetical protein IJY87_04140 [Bacilli bacterium]|nr:hypothetical protein [Bacilli bacterium]
MKKNMSEEVELLQYIYKNAEMGVIGIDNIITKVQDEKFEELLNNQKNEYVNICTEAENILKKYGKQNEEVGVVAKVSTKVMSEMSLLKENSTQSIAKMMVEGTNKGIIEIVEKINAYSNSDAEITVLANKLKNTLEKNIDDLKKYL